VLATGARVRAVVRDPRSAAAEKLKQRGAEVVHGDLDEPESLRTAFAGVDALAMTTLERGAEGEVEQGVAMADAALRQRSTMWSTAQSVAQNATLASLILRASAV
jgi:uncharacterized protein YbjT (DUF2867 family)